MLESVEKELKEILENQKVSDIAKLGWYSVVIQQKLSEDFIREFKGKLDWYCLSEYQKLSEDFIREFRAQLNWSSIAKRQKLSESFIREFKDHVDWYYTSEYQKLSEDFIREFKGRVDWSSISRFQILSEGFIREFKDEVDWDYISEYQKLSPEFRKEFKINISRNNWLYKTKKYKLDFIKSNTDYEVIDDEYIIAYKGIRSDNYSSFNFQYRYEVGQTYETHADYNLTVLNSFGFGAWDYKHAKNYCDQKIIKVKINIEDIAAIFKSENNKIRSCKLTVLEEVE